MTQNEFIEALKNLNISISNEQLSKLNRYYELLIEWNNKINLTGIVEKEQVYLKHFYDSITLIKIIDLNEYENLCDMGTGAGFPGLVLKILFPSLKITLLDSLNKRIDFLNLVIKELELKDIETIHIRIEEYSKINREKFDIVTARAVAPLPILLEYSLPMTKVSGYFIAMKANINNELETSKNAINILSGNIDKVLEFNLPFENSKRTLIKIKKVKPTSGKYPRKNSEIKKKSL